jgi:hypothetical protein
MPFDGTEQVAAIDVVRLIDHMLEAFGPKGENWIKGDERDEHGRMCLIGALKFSRRELRIKGDQTIKYMRQAFREIGPSLRRYGYSIPDFNDYSQTRFHHIRGLLLAARAIAEGRTLQIDPVEISKMPGLKTWDTLEHISRGLKV